MQPVPAVTGAETVAEYVTEDAEVWPAGVAYTHPTMGYQTVNLGFGIEFMADALLPDHTYSSGAADRVDLMFNIMEYFGKAPGGPGTGVSDGPAVVTRLACAAPNPFNPVTTVAYSTARRGRVTLRIHNLAGRVVRTLVDDARDPGEYEAVWDGSTDTGGHAASGVYFIRMTAPAGEGGFSDTRKVVLLK